jgi:putative methyltransferase (TIGR04325 family)
MSAVRHFLQPTNKQPPGWEYVPEGWSARDRIKGWNEESVVETQKARWPAFVRSLEGAGPLGIAHEATIPTREGWEAHNTLMCYAYVLTLATRKQDSLAILDWGGGAGHYYLFSKALLPDVHIEYHCYDTPMLCELGRELLPNASFHDKSDDVSKRQYDLVLASSSIQYFENWSGILRKLAAVTRGYLYVTRVPIVHRVPSFVVVQRPYQYGYKTEYLGWFLNRQEFLERAKDAGLDLVREFLIQERPIVKGAPEQSEGRGFLFRPSRVNR